MSSVRRSEAEGCSGGREEPRLRVLRGSFGDEAIAAEVEEVDAIFHFDTLLHQVADWDEVLEL